MTIRITHTCDRCGTEAKHMAITVRDHRVEKDAWELCDACSHEFEQFVGHVPFDEYERSER